MRYDVLNGALVVGALLFSGAASAADTTQAQAPIIGPIGAPDRPPLAPHPVIEPASSEIPVDHPWYVCLNPIPITDPSGYYPIRAQRLGIAGIAQIECRLAANATKVTTCVWITEDPPNYEFGTMAAKLGCLIGPNATMTPHPSESEDRIVKTTIHFELPGHPAR